MHFLLVRLGVKKDLNKVKNSSTWASRVSVTGGLDVDTLKLFEGVDVFTFIAGRGITEAADPAGAARAFKDEIRRIWGKPWHVQLEFMKRQPRHTLLG